MKERLATTATIFALVGGTGGAIAVGASSSHGGPHGGAAAGQYNSKTLKCKKHTHRVGNHCVKNASKSKAGVKGVKGTRGATRAPTSTGAKRGFTG